MVTYYVYGRYSVRFNLKDKFDKPWVVWDDRQCKRLPDCVFYTSDEAKAKARDLAGFELPAA